MANAPRQSNGVSDSFLEKEKVDNWAKALVASIGKKAARVILGDYEALSKSSKVTKVGKKIASKRAKALRRYT